MKFRIVTNGIRFKIQKKSLTPFLKRECWVDLGRPVPGLYIELLTVYYNTLGEARVDLVRFEEHDKKLIDWVEVEV